MPAASRTYLGVVLGGALLLGALGSCRHDGEYQWVEQLAPQLRNPGEPYVLKPGDVIGIRVWNQESNSVDRARVREDGRVSMPLLNDVEVSGLEPAELAQRLQVKLKTFLLNPVVTVVVHERPPLRVSVVGEVARPGMYELDTGAGVLQAIAAAGGLTPFADASALFVLRRGPPDGSGAPVRIRFRYKDLSQGKAPASTFRLRASDVVVVE